MSTRRDIIVLQLSKENSGEFIREEKKEKQIKSTGHQPTHKTVDPKFILSTRNAGTGDGP